MVSQSEARLSISVSHSHFYEDNMSFPKRVISIPYSPSLRPPPGKATVENPPKMYPKKGRAYWLSSQPGAREEEEDSADTIFFLPPRRHSSGSNNSRNSCSTSPRAAQQLGHLRNWSLEVESGGGEGGEIFPIPCPIFFPPTPLGGIHYSGREANERM